MKKITVLFAMFLLTACFDSKFEQTQTLHIQTYEGEVKSIIEDYLTQSKSMNNVEQILALHQTAIDDFTNVKLPYAGYKDESRLQDIISLYDYMFLQLINMQIQLIKIVSPIWNREITELENLKEYAYYESHQEFLSELLKVVDENKALIAAHHEAVRFKLVSSNLEEQERKRLWPIFNDLTIKYSIALNDLLHPIQTRIESERELSTFFYKNRDGYSVTKENGLAFNSYEMLDSYNSKLKAMQKQYQLTRKFSKLAKP